MQTYLFQLWQIIAMAIVVWIVVLIVFTLWIGKTPERRNTIKQLAVDAVWVWRGWFTHNIRVIHNKITGGIQFRYPHQNNMVWKKRCSSIKKTTFAFAKLIWKGVKSLSGFMSSSARNLVKAMGFAPGKKNEKKRKKVYAWVIATTAISLIVAAIIYTPLPNWDWDWDWDWRITAIVAIGVIIPPLALLALVSMRGGERTVWPTWVLVAAIVAEGVLWFWPRFAVDPSEIPWRTIIWSGVGLVVLALIVGWLRKVRDLITPKGVGCLLASLAFAGLVVFQFLGKGPDGEWYVPAFGPPNVDHRAFVWGEWVPVDKIIKVDFPHWVRLNAEFIPENEDNPVFVLTNIPGDYKFVFPYPVSVGRFMTHSDTKGVYY